MPTNIEVPRSFHGGGMPVGSGKGASIGDLGPAAILLTGGLIGLLVASLSGGASKGRYLVIAAPWTNLAQTINLITDADGGLVETGRFQNIAIAASPSAGFAARARDSGAWLVLPSPTDAGCFGAQTETPPL